MMLQTKMALRYLQGRKLRTFLTTLAVVFGVMVIFGLNGMLPAFTAVFRRNVLAGSNVVDLRVVSATQGTFSESVASLAGGVDGVDFALGILDQKVAVPASLGIGTAEVSKTLNLAVIGAVPERAWQLHPLTILEGRQLTSADRHAAVISKDLADSGGLKVGDTLVIPAAEGTQAFEIAGISDIRPYADPNEVQITLADSQELLDRPGEINAIELIFKPGADSLATQERVLAALGSGFEQGSGGMVAELATALQIGQTVMSLFGVMALAMGGFIIYNTFRTIVAERKRDIAMLRALGATRKTVVGTILVESLIQGVVGTALGMAAGYLMMRGALTMLAPLVQEFIHSSIGGPQYSLQAYVLSIGLGVGVTVFGGLIPALSTNRVSPLEALRPEVGEKVMKASRRGATPGAALAVIAVLLLVFGNTGLAALGMLLFTIGLILASPALVYPASIFFGRVLSAFLSAEGSLAEGNLRRQPGRSAITASAMMIGIMILVAMGGLVTSVRQGFMHYVDVTMATDYLLIPQSLVLSSGNVGAGPQLLEDIRNVPGMESATSLRLGITEVNGKSLQLIGVDPQLYPDLSGLVFSAGNSDEAFSALAGGRGLIVNGIFAAQNGVKLGQVLTIKTASGDQDYKVVGIGMDYLNAKLATGYISQAMLEQDFHETADLLIMANRSMAADKNAVDAALKSVTAPYPAFNLYSAETWRQSMQNTLDSSLSMMYVIMLVLAVPSLIALVNTLAINVIERTREIGMLRALGASRRQIRRMILGESLLLSALGTAFGILTGLWLGYIAIQGMNSAGFTMPYFFPLSGVLLAIALGLILGVVGAAVPARQAARLDIVRALHYE